MALEERLSKVLCPPLSVGGSGQTPASGEGPFCGQQASTGGGGLAAPGIYLLLALLSDVFLLSQAILMREAGRLNYHQRPSFLMDLGPELPQKASSRKLRRVGVEAVLGS